MLKTRSPKFSRQDVDGLAGVEQAPVEHGRKDADDLDLRVEVLAHHRERVLELDEPAEREVFGLDGDDHAVRGDEGVDRQQAERGRRVHQDVVVALADRDDRLLERALAADHRRQAEFRAGEVDRGDGEIDLALLDHLFDRQLVDEDVVHRPVDLVGVEALAHRQVALRVQVDAEDAQPLLFEGDGQVEGGRRLRHPALLVGECDHPCQGRSFRGFRPRVGSWKQPCEGHDPA